MALWGRSMGTYGVGGGGGGGVGRWGGDNVCVPWCG